MKLNLLIFILLGFSCSFCSSPKEDNVNTIPQSTIKGYLALGDSYTIGEGVSASERFPEILVEKLKGKDIEFEPPKIIARTGWTTGELLSAIENENIQGNFKLVTLLIGVNNQYRGLSVEAYRTELQELLRRALIFAANKPENVRVISIPDWGVSPFAASRDKDEIAAEIDLFNKVKKEEALKLNLPFVDITDISRTALGNPEYFAVDGLHFSKEMHELWVTKIIASSF